MNKSTCFTERQICALIVTLSFTGSAALSSLSRSCIYSSFPIKYDNIPFLPGLLKGLKKDNGYKCVYILSTKVSMWLLCL